MSSMRIVNLTPENTSLIGKPHIFMAKRLAR
jgi:hypothetical protein